MNYHSESESNKRATAVYLLEILRLLNVLSADFDLRLEETLEKIASVQSEQKSHLFGLFSDKFVKFCRL